jgi:predicted metal-dependent peptidase
MPHYTACQVTPEQQKAIAIGRMGLMAACPFFAHFMFSSMIDVPTMEVSSLCVDGRHIYINPEYFAGLKPMERVFAYAHEVDHAIKRHPQRVGTYHQTKRVPFEGYSEDFDEAQLQQSMDYCVNAGLLEAGIGQMNPAWLYADDVLGEDIPEEVYLRKYEKPDEGDDGSGSCPGGSRVGDSGQRNSGGQPDQVADGNGGSFDGVLPPSRDAAGAEETPTEAEFTEAVAAAANAAKAMGKMHAIHQKMVDEMMEAQVSWRDHIRMTMTGHDGRNKDDWRKANRRRLVIQPVIFMPGKRGFGCELVDVALDTSGSIYANPKAMEAFFTEVGGILQDIRPRTVRLIECDARVHQVQEANSLDELQVIRKAGVKGGGGTRFEPVFEWIAESGRTPETLIYLTDLEGSFPDAPPPYPVVWATIADHVAPFGDTILITG